MQALCSFQDDHFAYLVMEHMSGGDLFQLLVKGPFSSSGAQKTGVGEDDAKMIQAVSIDPHCNTIATNSHFGGEASSGGVSGGLHFRSLNSTSPKSRARFNSSTSATTSTEI